MKREWFSLLILEKSFATLHFTMSLTENQFCCDGPLMKIPFLEKNPSSCFENGNDFGQKKAFIHSEMSVKVSCKWIASQYTFPWNCDKYIRDNESFFHWQKDYCDKKTLDIFMSFFSCQTSAFLNYPNTFILFLLIFLDW